MLKLFIMTAETLAEANELNKSIREFQQALNCFEWENPEDPTIKISLNPRLIIEFDGDDECREQRKVPMNLSSAFVDFVKLELTNGKINAESKLLKL
jgi:hypothetical protein